MATPILNIIDELNITKKLIEIKENTKKVQLTRLYFNIACIILPATIIHYITIDKNRLPTLAKYITMRYYKRIN